MRLKPNYNQFNIMNSQEQMSVYREMMKGGFFSFMNSYRASASGVFGKMYHLMNEYDETNGRFGLANTQEAMNAYLREAEYRNTCKEMSPALMEPSPLLPLPVLLPPQQTYQPGAPACRVLR